MSLSTQIRLTVALFSGFAAAQGLPPAQPTSAPQPAAATSVPAAHRAQVTWNEGMLRVEANNSSLNGILRDIALRTGMKITGGVAEERVFGTYGPASADVVLQQLLDGTPSNMMLQMDSAGLPVLLTLTPHNGAATPPNPMQARPEPEEPVQQSQQGQPEPPPPPTSENPPQAAPMHDSSNNSPQPNSDSNQQSPNAVKTPQQIFEELQKLQQQRNSTPSTKK